VLAGLRAAVRNTDPGYFALVASHELGRALRVPWLVALGGAEAWAALGLWAAVLLALAGSVARATGREDRGRRR
jgi:hypothetical protein